MLDINLLINEFVVYAKKNLLSKGFRKYLRTSVSSTAGLFVKPANIIYSSSLVCLYIEFDIFLSQYL